MGDLLLNLQHLPNGRMCAFCGRPWVGLQENTKETQNRNNEGVFEARGFGAAQNNIPKETHCNFVQQVIFIAAKRGNIEHGCKGKFGAHLVPSISAESELRGLILARDSRQHPSYRAA